MILSQIRLLPTKNISSHFRKRWASGVGVSEDRREKKKMFGCFVHAAHIQRVNAGGVYVRALCVRDVR